MYLVGFPLLLIPFAIYNIVAFLMPSIGWADALTRLRFASGGEWTMSLGDILVALSILLLLVEIIKAYRHGGRYLTDHALSILLLVAACVEFYLVPRATTATFFLMIVASIADVVGGLVAMRRKPVEVFHDEPQTATVLTTEPPPPPDVEPVKPARIDPVVAATPAPDVPPPPVATHVIVPTDTSPSVTVTPDKPASDKTP